MSIEVVEMPKMYDPEEVAMIARDSIRSNVRVEDYGNSNKTVSIFLCVVPDLKLEIIATKDQKLPEGRRYWINTWLDGSGCTFFPNKQVAHEELALELRRYTGLLLGRSLAMASACNNALRR